MHSSLFNPCPIEMRVVAKKGKGERGGWLKNLPLLFFFTHAASPGKSSIFMQKHTENGRKRAFRASLYKKEVIFTKK